MGQRRSKLLIPTIVLFVILSLSNGAYGADTTTTTTTTTTPLTVRFTGGSISLLQLSESQLQVRFYYTKSSPEFHPRGNYSETWSISPAPQSGAATASYSWPNMGAGNSNGNAEWNSGYVFNATDLRSGTSYTVTFSGGYPGDSVSASRVITTLGSGWQTTTTVESSPESGSSTSSTTMRSPTTTIDAPIYMAQIDSENRVLQICVCSESFVRANPSRYPGTWVPAWMGVGGKNYPSPGMIYDWNAQNFYWPTPPTTTTSSTVPASGTTSTLVSGSITTSSSISESTSTPNSNSISSSTIAPVAPGASEVQVGGTSVAVETSIDTETGSATITAGEVSATINGGNTSTDEGDAPENALAFEVGSEVNLSASGFQPESEVDVIIFSEPTNLGQIKVDANGTVTAQVTLPSNLEIGNHTLVLNGVDAKNQPISVKFGLIVYGTDSITPIWVWLLVAALTLTLLASIWLNIQSRQRASISPS